MSVAEVFEGPGVRGVLHRPVTGEAAQALVMTHGAGSNAKAPMLVTMAEALSARGWLVLRCDLPYRQRRPGGPPRPAEAAGDRRGLRDAIALVRPMLKPGRRVVLGGHSYGGRQASMLLAEEPQVAEALLLCSYPLHPPGRPDQLRTQHLDKIAVPVLFVHGTKDPFGSPEEMRAAAKLVHQARLHFIEGAGHDLNKGKDLRFLDEL
jgi:uncharacterized protein